MPTTPKNTESKQMAIWTQIDRVREFHTKLIETEKCLYCQVKMAHFTPERYYEPGEAVKVCTNCGWWTYSTYVERCRPDPIAGQQSCQFHLGSYSVLRNLDLSDFSLPIHDIRNFLIAKYDSRYEVHPRQFEKIVADVFKDAGFRPRVTGYTADGGIDVVLDGDSEKSVGIQVKRWKGKIRVEQIREFVGALYLNGMTRGIFVTTSDFPSGAKSTAAESDARGIAIELLNADRFYDALKVYRRPLYSSFEEWKSEIGELELHTIKSGTWGYAP